MPLYSLKWLIMAIILLISVMAGFATLRIANRYKKWISLGEALANGIFLGGACFHLLPAASTAFLNAGITYPLLTALLITFASFIVLTVLEKNLTDRALNFRHVTHILPLILTLSIHAFLTGLAVGISKSYLVIISLLIAILAHKAFEMFALVINLHRNIKQHHYLRLVFIAFSLVTPLGILVGSSPEFLNLFHSALINAYLNAICAGTFFYIATIHTHHRHHPYGDGYQKYIEILATLVGISLMGILAFWI